MKDCRDINRQEFRAPYLVWGVVAVGLIAGGVMFGTFTLSTRAARTNQATMNQVAAGLDGLLSAVVDYLTDSQREISALLDGHEPENQLSGSTASSLAEIDRAHLAIRTEIADQTFDRLSQTLTDIAACRDEARKWLTEDLEVEPAVNA